MPGPSESRRLAVEEWRDRAAEAGVPPEDFWRQTPRETAVTLRALAAIRRRSHQLALFTAWHAAAFERIDRMPELAPLLERLDGRAGEEQDPDEQIAAARSIVAAFGGRGR